MRRVNTASSFFKRLLSRNDSQPATPATSDAPTLNVPVGNTGKLPKSASNASLAGSKLQLGPGTVRITDQVIEEVDEQMTITSMRQEVRPKAEDLFNQGPMTAPQAPAPPLPSGPPPASKPVDVPMRSFGGPSNAYSRAYSTVGQDMNDKFGGDKDEFVSCSAPTTHFQPPTPPGFDEYDRQSKDGMEPGGGGGGGGMGTGDVTGGGGADDDDDFERLRIARERERNERQRLNIARSISTTQGSNPTNLNVDLVEALAASIADDLNHTQQPQNQSHHNQSNA